MRGWWNADTTMEQKVGGEATFGFDRREAVFRMTIDTLKPDQAVKMHCTRGPPEWVGTTLEWTIEPSERGDPAFLPRRLARAHDIRRALQFDVGAVDVSAEGFGRAAHAQPAMDRMSPQRAEARPLDGRTPAPDGCMPT